MAKELTTREMTMEDVVATLDETAGLYDSEGREKEVDNKEDLTDIDKDNEEEQTDGEDDSETFEKDDKGRHTGRSSRRRKTALYKGRMRDRADCANKNLPKREAEDGKNNKFRVDKTTGDKIYVSSSAMSRHGNLTKEAEKYKTKAEKAAEAKESLQREANVWKERADKAIEAVKAAKKAYASEDELAELRAKADRLSAKAKEVQEAADAIKVK